MSDELASTNTEGKLARAGGRVLVGHNQYATIAVTCHIQATQSSTGDDIEQLGEKYLTTTSTYALGLVRALADGGTPPSRVEVNAECELDRTGSEPRLSVLALDVRGDVHGGDQQTFEAAAGDPTLLQSAWALPPTTNVRVVAQVNSEVDPLPSADEPADAATTGLARPRGVRLSRRLVLVALLGVAVLVYLAMGTPVLGMFGTVRDRLPQPLGLGSAGASAAPTATIAVAGATTSPTMPAAAVSIEQPTTPASLVPVQAEAPIAPTLTSPAPQPTPPPATPPPATPVPAVAPAASPSVTQPPAGGGFAETFASNARRWPDNPSSTTWFGNGGYRLTPRVATQFVALRAPLSASFGDVRVTGVFRKVAGPPGGGYGLILRDQSPAPLDGISQTGRYYVFEVGDRDGVGIWRRENDRWIDILAWTPSPAVHGQDGTNELIAEARGTQLDFFVNGVLVANAEDATLAEGSVGIFTGGDGNDVLLTRFAVEPLS